MVCDVRTLAAAGNGALTSYDVAAVSPGLTSRPESNQSELLGIVAITLLA